MIQVNENGESEVQLYKFTDAVLSQPENVSIQEKEDVAANWPTAFQNMLVISIRPDRLERFCQRVGPLSRYVTHIMGVNGESLDPELLKKQGSYSPINDLNELSRGQLGCFLSHRKAWQHIVDHELEFGFILEDDCEITPNKETLMILKLAVHEARDIAWDVLFAGRNPALCKVRKKLRPHVVQVGKTWGLFAYVVTLKSARELLAASVVIDDAVDCFVSTTREAAKVKLAISPIPFIVVEEHSDTVNIK